ncbi:hypothetical protein EDB80DRAFT_734654 [Ilyonectria destructans]|nr:hypothetical protein EDB80DRAFT_734654 [Ilyonectria destructans]
MFVLSLAFLSQTTCPTGVDPPAKRLPTAYLSGAGCMWMKGCVPFGVSFGHRPSSWRKTARRRGLTDDPTLHHRTKKAPAT